MIQKFYEVGINATSLTIIMEGLASSIDRVHIQATPITNSGSAQQVDVCKQVNGSDVELVFTCHADGDYSASGDNCNCFVTVTVLDAAVEVINSTQSLNLI